MHGKDRKKEKSLAFCLICTIFARNKKTIMNSIVIKKVTDKKGLKQFIRFYYDLYRGSKYAVPFLSFDEWNTLNRKKNPSFECCDTEYFMAWRDGKPVGRVAAIINKRANERWKRKLVRFGWFDFVDDIEVSKDGDSWTAGLYRHGSRGHAY